MKNEIIESQENGLALLPVEVAEIAKSVSAEKRYEVQAVLNNVFDGVSKMREQLDMVNVADAEDKASMRIANTIRLGVRQVRLQAEKTFDAKRAEVQQQMLSYKTEDSLWLKAKQTMQILTKEIEENARWKEETRVRFEAEQKELKVQQRIFEVSKVAPELSRSEFENMGDEAFEMFLAGITRAYQDRIQAEQKAEEERLAKLKAEAEERERIRIENEKLRAEALEKERLIAKERAEAEQKLKAEREASRIAAEKAEMERRKLAAEIEAKRLAEERERKAILAAQKKAANAPDKTKLLEFAAMLDNLKLPDLKGEEGIKIAFDVKGLLVKVSTYIRDKSSGL